MYGVEKRQGVLGVCRMPQGLGAAWLGSQTTAHTELTGITLVDRSVDSFQFVDTI